MNSTLPLSLSFSHHTCRWSLFPSLSLTNVRNLFINLSLFTHYTSRWILFLSVSLTQGKNLFINRPLYPSHKWVNSIPISLSLFFTDHTNWWSLFLHHKLVKSIPTSLSNLFTHHTREKSIPLIHFLVITQFGKVSSYLSLSLSLSLMHKRST